MVTGSCLCGGIAYEVTSELGPVALCHCGMCRKASGSAFASNASVSRDGFRLTRGADLVQRYESSPGRWRCFCRVCGSPVFSEAREGPGLVRLRLGLFDDDPGVRPAYHWAVNFKAPWWTITDALPQQDQQGS
jgi:hypothetical protein